MPTCRYCWTPYETDRCPTCEKDHLDAIKRPAKGSTGRKAGRPYLDIQEGNSSEQFGDHERWREEGGDA